MLCPTFVKVTVPTEKEVQVMDYHIAILANFIGFLLKVRCMATRVKLLHKSPASLVEANK
jgi:hypothetical protein